MVLQLLFRLIHLERDDTEEDKEQGNAFIEYKMFDLKCKHASCSASQVFCYKRGILLPCVKLYSITFIGV